MNDELKQTIIQSPYYGRSDNELYKMNNPEWVSFRWKVIKEKLQGSEMEFSIYPDMVSDI